MTDRNWIWKGTPIKELTREELTEALVGLGEAYWHASETLHDQSKVAGELFGMAMRMSDHAQKLYYGQSEAVGRMKNMALKWLVSADNG